MTLELVLREGRDKKVNESTITKSRRNRDSNKDTDDILQRKR